MAIYPKLSLRKGKLPFVFDYYGMHVFNPYRAFQVSAGSRWIEITGQDRESVTVEARGQKLKLLKRYMGFVVCEWSMWKEHYLPSFSPRNKTILDVGAGCGETAFFFFSEGAQKVIAVEPSAEAASCLRENAIRNGWNIEIVPEPFSLSHLSIPHDYLKVDCHGCESLMLSIDYPRPLCG